MKTSRDSPENIRKPKIFWCFQGNQKGTLERKGLMLNYFWFPSVSSKSILVSYFSEAPVLRLLALLTKKNSGSFNFQSTNQKKQPTELL